jgi:hypothetical protein
MKIGTLICELFIFVRSDGVICYSGSELYQPDDFTIGLRSGSYCHELFAWYAVVLPHKACYKRTMYIGQHKCLCGLLMQQAHCQGH